MLEKALVPCKLSRKRIGGSQVGAWKKSVQWKEQVQRSQHSGVFGLKRADVTGVRQMQGEQPKMRLEGCWGAGSCDTTKASVEGMLTSCSKFPRAAQIPN